MMMKNFVFMMLINYLQKYFAKKQFIASLIKYETKRKVQKYRNSVSENVCQN